jgi:hypothetical protein
MSVVNPVSEFHAKLIRTKIVVRPNQTRKEQEIISNDNGIIKRKFRVQTKKRRPKHVSFVVPENAPVSTTIDRMPTPFVPEIQFVVNKHNETKKKNKRRSKKGRRTRVDKKK